MRKDGISSERVLAAARAFRLANRAMLYQQVRSRLEPREVSADRTGYTGPRGLIPWRCTDSGLGRWRAFQIAFILASLPEMVESPDDPGAPSST